MPHNADGEHADRLGGVKVHGLGTICSWRGAPIIERKTSEWVSNLAPMPSISDTLPTAGNWIVREECRFRKRQIPADLLDQDAFEPSLGQRCALRRQRGRDDQEWEGNTGEHARSMLMIRGWVESPAGGSSAVHRRGPAVRPSAKRVLGRQD